MPHVAGLCTKTHLDWFESLSGRRSTAGRLAVSHRDSRTAAGGWRQRLDPNGVAMGTAARTMLRVATRPARACGIVIA